MAQDHLQPRTRKVFQLILDGKMDEAESYIQSEFSSRISRLEVELQEAQQERSLLLNAVALAKRSVSTSVDTHGGKPSLRLRFRPNRPSKDDRREAILLCALEVAKKRDGLVPVQAVVDALKEKGVELGMEKPNTSVGNMLHKSDEWRREGRALFRYMGKQLDLRRGK